MTPKGSIKQYRDFKNKPESIEANILWVKLDVNSVEILGAN